MATAQTLLDAHGIRYNIRTTPPRLEKCEDLIPEPPVAYISIQGYTTGGYPMEGDPTKRLSYIRLCYRRLSRSW